MSASETFTMPLRHQAHTGYWRVKRLADIIISACLLLLLAPLLLLIACAIKITSPDRRYLCKSAWGTTALAAGFAASSFTSFVPCM